ncbi:uncharacterized protein LOC141651801 [Silene latifolia]|uniref:uncharacterized protein LOC141651801 n=1 Tax=Silene latifolia TaxID=37657 RepID=UPI003D785E2D
MKDLLASKAGSPGFAVGWIQDCSIHGQFNSGMLVMENKLPTIDNLVHRGLHLINICVLCCQHSEDIHHLFFLCPFSSKVWIYMAAWLQTTSSTSLDHVISWFQDHIRGCSLLSGRKRAGLMATIYFLWKERNSRIFRGISSNPESLSFHIQFVVVKRLSL